MTFFNAILLAKINLNYCIVGKLLVRISYSWLYTIEFKFNHQFQWLSGYIMYSRVLSTYPLFFYLSLMYLFFNNSSQNMYFLSFIPAVLFWNKKTLSTESYIGTFVLLLWRYGSEHVIESVKINLDIFSGTFRSNTSVSDFKITLKYNII